MVKKFKLALGAVVAAAMAFGSVASTQAATTLKSGDTVDGWVVSFPKGISLIDDGGGNLTLEKFAVFTSLEGLAISFTQKPGTTASSSITIADEGVTNLSGQSWGGFQFLLVSPLAGTPASFTGSFADSAISPFSSQSDSSSSITLKGGSLGEGETGLWGFGSTGGALSIAAPTSTAGSAFFLKEIPLLIPLPAAAWSALSGLGLLAVVGVSKKARRLLA